WGPPPVPSCARTPLANAYETARRPGRCSWPDCGGADERPAGQPIIIGNIAGAEGSLGTGRAARARPDGYTIELGVLSTRVLDSAFYSLPYDAPISPLVGTTMVLFARNSISEIRPVRPRHEAHPCRAGSPCVLGADSFGPVPQNIYMSIGH